MFKSKPFFIILFLVVAGGALSVHLRERSYQMLPQIRIAQHDAGGYSLYVNDSEYVIRGVCFSPIPTGKDYLFNFWGDPDNAWEEDAKLMKKMGVNTVRFYKAGKDPEEVKQVVRKLHRRYDIRSLMGHHLGFMDWPPPNYTNAGFREKVTREVLAMVEEYKNEPGLLAWILGNENNYSFDLNVKSWSSEELDAITDIDDRNEAKARLYYTFVNDLAKKVKEIDPIRPVIMGVGEVKSLAIAGEVAPDIDILGVIAYRGPTFGNLFRQVQTRFSRPLILIEWGADRFNAYTEEEDEITQAQFVKLQWQDIEKNLAGEDGRGIAIGGTLFEWSDEWWKGNENLAHTWLVHDKTAQWSSSAYYYDYEAAGRLNMNEEWWGVVGLKPRTTEEGPDIRVPKKAYYVLKDLWT